MNFKMVTFKYKLFKIIKSKINIKFTFFYKFTNFNIIKYVGTKIIKFIYYYYKMFL